MSALYAHDGPRREKPATDAMRDGVLGRVPSVDKEKHHQPGGYLPDGCAAPERASDRPEEVLFYSIAGTALGCQHDPRTGETKGRRENACAPERPCAVFLLARIRHWNS
jgi:hypothetical protein